MKSLLIAGLVIVCTTVLEFGYCQKLDIVDKDAEDEDEDLHSSCRLEGEFVTSNARCWVTSRIVHNDAVHVGQSSLCQIGQGDAARFYKCTDGQWEATGLRLKPEVRLRRAWWRRRRPAPPPPPPPNQPPQLPSCPGVSATAASGTTSAHVTWSVPTATDPNGGSPTVTQIAGPAPGSLFNEGGTEIRYRAKDSGGLTAECSFQVTVNVYYCPGNSIQPHFPHGTQTCSGEKPNIYGSTCTHTCDAGYLLEGAESVTCQSDSTWSSSFPSCQPVSCGEPGIVAGGELQCPEGHVYPKTCDVICRPGYQHTGSSSTSCTATGVWSQIDPCVDVAAPEFPSGCPANKQVFSGPLESPVTVTWDDPVASDNSGQSVTLTSSPSKGSALGLGSHTVRVTATDSVGNEASCEFHIAVQARQCQILSPPAHADLTCSLRNVEGSQCTVNCHLGYKLQGQATLTCLQTEQWDAAIPVCEAIMCPAPPETEGGIFVCNGGHQYPAVCTLTCNPGYAVQSPTEIHCFENATWSVAGSCHDVEPPVFPQDCPSDINVYAEPLGTDTLVNWEDPDVTDNSGKTVMLTSDVTAGSSFSSGDTTVTYTAVDVSGNEKACSFSVAVSVLSCGQPDLEATNQTLLTYSCLDGYVYGAMCTVNCTQGYRLVGEETITCNSDFNTHPPTPFWEWPGPYSGKPECKEDKCPALNPPKHGALSCFLGNMGWDCLMSCDASWDIPVRTNGHFFCLNELGRWTPATAPDCVVPMRPTRLRLQADLFYLSDSCHQAPDEFRENFITRINESIMKDLCANVPSCVAKNVEISCGQVAERKRRESEVSTAADSHEADLTNRLNRVQRSTGKSASHYVLLTFHVHVHDGKEDLSPEELYQRYLVTKDIIHETLRSHVTAGSLNVDQMSVEESSIGQATVHADCPPGTVFRARDNLQALYCTGCGSGHYLSEVSTQCEACPVGSYTELDNATSCTPCPPGWSTLTTGSKNSSDCKEQCLAGSSSYNGFVPCLQCSAGRFQPQVEAKTCELCPAGTWTIAGGSTDFDQCVPADVSLADTSMSAILTGQWSSSTSSVWISLEAGALARVDIEFGSGGYLPFSASLYTSTTDVALVPAESPTSAVVQVDPVTWSRLVFVADLENALTTVYHQSHVLLSFNQTSFTSPSSAVMNISVSQGKATVSGLHAVNRTLTQSEVSAPSTTCSGDNADNIAMWSPQPASVQIPSVCDAVDECQNQPCGNFPCVNGRGHFECQCKDGWSGDTCSTPPDACYQHNCQNGATCVPGGSNYTCSCVEGFAGTHCNLVKVDGNYGDWTMWTECSATCGGSQQRHRLCNNPAPQNGGSDCVGASVDTRVCGETFCPIQGAWSEWTPWGQCSTSCQGGARTRTRTCDNPSPQHGGGDCDGLNTETEACSTHVCPVHGGYGDWSGWTPCSVTCGDGQTTRHRTCDNPAPANGGNPCSGPSNETQACNLGKCPECAQLLRSHGTLPPICNETSNPYLKSCSVQCAPGYTSHLGFPLYTCGEETAYLWNNQRDASSIALLPGCQRSKTLQQASMKQHITMNADCEENTISVVRSGVQANVDGLPCVQQKVCSTQVQSTCVDAGSGRKKRSTGLLQLILNMTVNFGPSQLYTGNDTSSSQYDRLVNLGLDSAEIVLLNDTAAFFTVTAGSQTVTPDLASMFYNTSFLCPSGSIAYSYVCVDCPTGYKEENGDCVPCPLGQYQDQTGSTQCKPCPDGLAWDVLAASSISQCILPFTHNSPSKPDDAEQEYNNANQRLALIVGLVFGAVVVVVFTVAMIAVYKHQSGKTTKSHDYTMKQRPWSASSNRVSPGPWADHDVPLELETSPPPYSSLSPVSARDFHLGQEGDKIYAYTKGRLPPVDTDM